VNEQAAADLATCTQWRKARASQAENNCVEVARTAQWVGIRDSKNPDGPFLAVPAARWQATLEGLRNAGLT
jgi:hypothetical protein